MVKLEKPISGVTRQSEMYVVNDEKKNPRHCCSLDKNLTRLDLSRDGFKLVTFAAHFLKFAQTLACFFSKENCTVLHFLVSSEVLVFPKAQHFHMKEGNGLQLEAKEGDVEKGGKGRFLAFPYPENGMPAYLAAEGEE